MQDSLAQRPPELSTIAFWPVFVALVVGLAVGAALGWWLRGRTQGR